MTLSSETTTIYDVAKSKLAAETQLGHAKITLCRFGGMGVLAALAGMGIGLACFGYSYVADGRVQAQKIADAMVQALEKAQLTTTGEIRLAAESTVSLAPGGQVALAPNSVVRMDPSSTVRVAGTVNADLNPATAPPPVLAAPLAPGGIALAPNSVVRMDPSSTVRVAGTVNAELNPATAPPPVLAAPLPQNKVITQYTTFKIVPFDKGKVVSGWHFENSDQTVPSSQYCYYEEKSVDTVRLRTDLASNGKMLDNLKPYPGQDLIGAFRNCTWFSDTH